MLGNLNLNNILLLGLVGLLIFYLMNPSQIPNEGEIEEEVSEEVVAPKMDTPVSEGSSLTPVSEGSSLTSVNGEEEVTAENVAIPMPAQEIEREGDVGQVSGLSQDSKGANLDTAFIGAIEPGTAVDEIDFTKNNVTEYDSAQYLPKEVNDEWFETDFTQAKYNLNDDKLINTNRYIIGVNTVGQSLKNPSYDIRGTIPNPKYTVSPWLNSTYEPDTNIKPLY